MKITLVFLLLLSCAFAISWKDEIVKDFEKLELKKHFNEWKKAFKRTYNHPDEEALKFAIFVENWRKVNNHNKNKLYNWTMGLNQFADMTVVEFRYYIHGSSGPCLRRDRNKHRDYVSPSKSVINVPDSVDWTTKGVVTPVKNQGSCGSCWAFSTTGAVESRSAIKTGKLVSLSEQQLIDCSRRDGDLGCQGGLMDDAFKYVKTEGGLCTEKEYPYEAKNGLCRAAACGTKYDPITGYIDVKHDSSPDLKAAVAAGPVSIAVEADQSSWQLYKSGVMTGKCGAQLDHGVLAVGYGTESGTDYWKVKNSWGASWGMNGYLLICRDCNKNGEKGECGILSEPSYPLV